MKETGLICCPESVRGILADRKTLTRRVMKPQPDKIMPNEGWYELCPYGIVGDRLWVREAWMLYNHMGTFIGNIPERLPKDLSVGYKANGLDKDNLFPWRSPLFMPKWAARIWLEKTSNRAPEKVQEIAMDDDIFAEGYVIQQKAPTEWFIDLWDSLNAKPKCTKHNPYTGARENCYVGYPWEDIRTEKKLRCGFVEYIVGNPFVWPIEFKRVRETA